MSENCTHDCSSCSSNCKDRTKQNNFLEKPNSLSRIKKVIGIVSGKGGVGKSLVTSMLAVILKRRGYSTAVLDADITGPSIPKIFGIKTAAETTDLGLMPVSTNSNIEIMSINLLLENTDSPVIWRGPILANTVKQFWSDVIWGDVDFMFVDMPPGTGDVPLTVFQSIPLDGIIMVTSPQELVSMIVSKAVNMAKMMNIPILGFIENYSYILCPGCKTKIKVFGESHIEDIAKKHNINVLAQMPIDPEIASLCDKGLIELFENEYLEGAADYIEGLKG